MEWFCERGDFWGTVNQLILCARCGKNELKRHDEPRHFCNIFKRSMHVVCDACFDELPGDDEEPEIVMMPNTPLVAEI